MTLSLPRISHEHHERLMRHVDQMPAVGDLISGREPLAELRPHIDETCGFLTGLLIPHMEAAERNLYPELERLLQNRHSMTPMRREHAEILRLVDDLVRLRKELDNGRTTTGEAVALPLRRDIFRLYALLKIHLAEEEGQVHRRQVALDELESGLVPERREICLLPAAGIVRHERIDAQHLGAFLEQAPAEVRADEPRRPGHQCPHAWLSPPLPFHFLPGRRARGATGPATSQDDSTIVGRSHGGGRWGISCQPPAPKDATAAHIPSRQKPG